MDLRQLFGIESPVVQAPMAGAQGSAMAIAVCQAGGLGSLPCAMLGTERIRSEIATIRAHTAKPFNVNFFCHTQPVFDLALETRWRKKLAPYYQEFGIDEASIQITPSRRLAVDKVTKKVIYLVPDKTSEDRLSFEYKLPKGKYEYKAFYWEDEHAPVYEMLSKSGETPNKVIFETK